MSDREGSAPEATARIGRRYLVTGVVQGVGFRWTVRDLARSLGVTGTVRNLPDGAVEIEAHGAAAAIRELRRALGTRTPGRVDAVREDPAVPAGRSPSPRGFRVVL